MDERLKIEAQSGNIDALDTIFEEDPNVLDHIVAMGLIDTPVHIAAVSGHSDFAMEMMNLKPSFGRKLNQDRLAPIHLAYLNQHTEMVIDFLWVDKNLARVKGREGLTVVHLAAWDGDVHLSNQILYLCPSCIFDLTFWRQSALHIAAENNQVEALETMVAGIHPSWRSGILNLEDKDGNTVLHLAALNNQPQMIRVLINCVVINKKKKNKMGFTAMDLLETQTQADTRESVNILNTNHPRILEWVMQPTEIEPATLNILLFIFSVALTVTFASVLSPPGGVYQVDAGGGTGGGTSNPNKGKSVMDSFYFHMFYVPNALVFSISLIGTSKLLSGLAPCIWRLWTTLYLMMFCCYMNGIHTIAPSFWDAAVLMAVSVFAMICCVPSYLVPANEDFNKNIDV